MVTAAITEPTDWLYTVRFPTPHLRVVGSWYLLHFSTVAFPIHTSVPFVTFTIFSFVFFVFSLLLLRIFVLGSLLFTFYYGWSQSILVSTCARLFSSFFLVLNSDIIDYIRVCCCVMQNASTGNRYRNVFCWWLFLACCCCCCSCHYMVIDYWTIKSAKSLSYDVRHGDSVARQRSTLTKSHRKLYTWMCILYWLTWWAPSMTFGKKKKHVQRKFHIIRLYMESLSERIVSWIRDGY